MTAVADLARRRCLTHPAREAAARCTECREDFCRECVTDHSGRMICSSCLARLAARRPATGRRPLDLLRRAALLGLGLLVAWGSFYALGRTLMLLPAEYHSAVATQGDSQ